MAASDEKYYKKIKVDHARALCALNEYENVRGAFLITRIFPGWAMHEPRYYENSNEFQALVLKEKIARRQMAEHPLHQEIVFFRVG